MAGEKNKRLILAAMVFAVAMLFIDQTIVALAIPSLQDDVHLSATGAQWVINGYLLSLSAFFALGGKLADTYGHRTTVLIGIVSFAVSSALCGLTPTGDAGEAWLIVFRIVQGASGALLFPAALAIVVSAYPVQERGKALAIFFSVTGGLTAVGPLAGGYLTEWTWRAIFWVNIPVAIIGLILTLRAKPDENRNPTPVDKRGAFLVSAGMALAVLALQQSTIWGWSSPATWGCLVVGLAILARFVQEELRVSQPLLPMRLFANEGFRADNAVLFLLSITFVPLFFFASLYAQVALGDSASNAGLFLLVFFGGFTIGAQRGGRVLDKEGARPAVIPGCAVAAIGFALWAHRLNDLSFNNQWYFLALAGLGVGMVLGPVSTDALNRASRATYGAVTGVTQTVRNFGGSLGMAILGSILISQNDSRIGDTLAAAGVPAEQAAKITDGITSGTGGGPPPGTSDRLLSAVQLDFANSTARVVYVMAGVMAVAFVVAVVGMPRGRAGEEAVAAEAVPAAGEPAA